MHSDPHIARHKAGPAAAASSKGRIGIEDLEAVLRSLAT